jgi:Asp-tRNA(Asn)/Glu-tRNA(Gln) amidotransferase B subunit
MESKSDNFSANLNKLVRFFERTDGGYAFASTRVQANIQVVNSETDQALGRESQKNRSSLF